MFNKPINGKKYKNYDEPRLMPASSSTLKMLTLGKRCADERLVYDHKGEIAGSMVFSSSGTPTFYSNEQRQKSLPLITYSPNFFNTTTPSTSAISPASLSDSETDESVLEPPGI